MPPATTDAGRMPEWPRASHQQNAAAQQASHGLPGRAGLGPPTPVDGDVGAVAVDEARGARLDFAADAALPGDSCPMSLNPRHAIAPVVTALVAFFSLAAKPATAQTKGCEPIADRAGRKFGCFITAREELGPLPKDSAFYWHLDAFATRAAADAARARRSTVVSPRSDRSPSSRPTHTRPSTWKACSGQGCTPRSTGIRG
jgi:hypothetical protein